MIVTDGASEVDARGGDDLVCITGSAYNPSVDAGTGNDVVDASASRTGSQSELGAGSDRYLGSTGFDVSPRRLHRRELQGRRRRA